MKQPWLVGKYIMCIQKELTKSEIRDGIQQSVAKSEKWNRSW